MRLLKITLRPVLFLLFYSSAYSQNYCNGNRFGQLPYFNDSSIDVYHGSYGVAADWLGNTDTLNYDLFYPSPAVDTMHKHPFIMLIHGGAFVIGDKSDEDSLCFYLAQCGYITASINYRLGWNYGTSNCDGDTNQLKAAVYRAVQDAKAAMRYFVFYSDSAGIDTAALFMGGASAGGATTIFSYFLSQQNFNALDDSLYSSLGALDSSSNTLYTSYTLKGIIDMWGAITDTSLITSSNTLPMVMFQGTTDPVVPYDTGRFNSCYSPEAYPYLCGGHAMASKLQQLGTCVQLNYVIGGGHGVYNNIYIAEHSACFIKSIFCSNCTSVEQTTSTPDCIITGINGYSENKDNYFLYPDPVKDKFTVNSSQFTVAHMEIYNVLGQVCQQSEISNLKPDIDVSSLPPGIYIINISGKTPWKAKFVKE